MTIADRRDRDLNVPDIYPGQAIGGPVNEQEIRVTNLANTITSLSVLRAAFEELVAKGVIRDNSPASFRKFVADIEVRPLRGSEFLTIAYVGDDYEDAKVIIEVLRDKFLARYNTLNSQVAQRTVDFIEESLREQRAIYDQKLQEQKEFMEKYPEATAYDQNTGALVMRMNQVRERIAEADRTEAAALETIRVAKLQASSPLMKPPVATGKGRSPLYDEVERRLAGSRTSLEALRETYGEMHPRVKQLKESIAEDEKLLKDLESADSTYIVSGTTTTDTSEAEGERRLALVKAEQSLHAARLMRARSLAELAGLQVSFDRLPVVQKELARMGAEIAAQAQTVNNLESKLQEARIRAGQNERRGVYFLDNALVQEVDPAILLKTSIAFFLSLILAVSLIASLGQFDQAAYTAADAENMLGFPVIAALPKSSQQRLNPDVEQPTPLAASYQILSTQIMAIKEKLVGPGILVAAAEPNVGRTTVAANLAISLARDGSRVLLIDGDMRNPALHAHFGLQNRAGLAEILSGEATLEDVVQPTGVEGLLFIAAGQPPVNPVRLLRGPAMDQLIEQISKGADFIVIDSPAGSAFGDATVLSENVQNVVLIHEAGRAPSEAEYEFHKSLERLGVNVIGLVLNKTQPSDCPSYQNYRRDYEAAISRYHPLGGRAALGPGTSAPTQKPQQYGRKSTEEEEE